MLSWALTILTCLLSLVAACVSVACWRAFASSPTLKWRRDMEQQISDLNSNFESLLDSHKRLRSRQGMQELRARRSGAKTVETKAELLARLGLAGKSGPDFARAQLRLVGADDTD